MNIVDRLNPVLLKEFRQMVRGKSLLVFLWLFLGFSFLISFFFYSNGITDGSTASGSAMCCTITLMLLLVIWLAIPTVTFLRLSKECQKDRVDMQYSTILTSREFIDGKALCGYLLCIVFFCVAQPFILASYMLKGADILIIVTFSFFTLVLMFIPNYVAVFFGSLPYGFNAKRIFYILLFLIPAFFCCLAMTTILATAFDGEFSEITQRIFPITHEGVAILSYPVAVTITAVGILRAMAMKFLSHKNADKNTHPRLLLLFLLVFWFIYNMLLARYSWIMVILSTGCFGLLACCGILFFDAISEPDETTWIPKDSDKKGSIARVGCYLIKGGRNSGIIYSTLYLFLCIGAFFLLFKIFPIMGATDAFESNGDSINIVYYCGTRLISFFALGLLVRNIWFYLFRRKYSSLGIGFISVGIYLILPLFFLFLSLFEKTDLEELFVGKILKGMFGSFLYFDAEWDEEFLLSVIRLAGSFVLAIPMFFWPAQNGQRE